MSTSVHDYVAAKKAAWCTTNPGEKPNENHIKTWTDMGIDLLVGREAPDLAPPELTDAERSLVNDRLASHGAKSVMAPRAEATVTNDRVARDDHYRSGSVRPPSKESK